MSIRDASNVPLPLPRPPQVDAPKTVPPNQQAPTKLDGDQGSQKDFLSTFKSDQTFAKPQNKSYQEMGEEGKKAQAIIFNGGGYQSRDTSSPAALKKSFDTEVDGKIGPRTEAAFKNTQELLKKAGFYNGPVNGQFNADMAKGLDQLRSTERLPTEGLSPEEQQRLGSLARAASQKTVTPVQPSQEESAFSRNAQAPAGAPNITGASKQVDGAKVLDNLTSAIGNQVDPKLKGPERTEAIALATAQMAQTDPKLTTDQNNAVLMAKFKQLGNLGFDPTHNEPDKLRSLLMGHAQELASQAQSTNTKAIAALGQNATAISPMITDPQRQKEAVQRRLESLAGDPAQVRKLTGLPDISDARAKAYVDAVSAEVNQHTTGVGPRLNLPAIPPPPPAKIEPATTSPQRGAPGLAVPTPGSGPWTLGAD
jgi:hypothetical protein